MTIEPANRRPANPLTDGITMIRDIRALGGFIRIWGGLLNIPQILGGLVLIGTAEGLAILLTVILTLVLAGEIHRRTPFSRAIGLCHLPWLALLPWLVWRLTALDHGPAVTAFLIYVCATIGISLAFDARDIWLFARGDRRFAWARSEK